jgi:hypothetical protein
MNMTTADMTFEVLSAAWRPMTVLELRGAMREMFAVNPDLTDSRGT